MREYNPYEIRVGRLPLFPTNRQKVLHDLGQMDNMEQGDCIGDYCRVD